MPLYCILSFFLAVVFAQVPEVLFEWTALDFTWNTQAERDQRIVYGKYIPENCALSAVRYWRDEYYVSVPRFREGVPSTLNKVVVRNGQPLLQPYPSWKMNTVGLPGSFVSVQSMEIDPRNRMWIIDSGRMNIYSSSLPPTNSSARLFIYDMVANAMIRSYTFPEEVASKYANFLSDIVLDYGRGYAYISDSGTGALVVYEYRSHSSRRIVTYGMIAETQYIDILGLRYNISTPMNGLALSPNADKLYYCPLASYHIYSLPTEDLRDFKVLAEVIHSHVLDEGTKISNSDGLAVSSSGVMYYGLLANNALGSWNVKRGSLATQQSTVSSTINATTHNWVDTLSFDKQGLIYTTNRLAMFLSGGMNFNFTGIAAEANFRIMRLPKINETSYLYGQTDYSATTSLSSSLATLAISIVLSICTML